jgi:glycosyltransferase involved in cell wall biosynthesis
VSGLRFCFPTTFYPPYSFGGDAVGVQRFARALVKRGNHVTVVHDVDAYMGLFDGPEPTPGPDDDGVEVIRLKSGAGILSPILTHQVGRPTLNHRRLGEILNDGRFDVVNFHNASLVGGPGIFSYGNGASKVFMAHDHWLVCPTHVLWRHKREVCTARECVRCQMHYHRPPQLWRSTGFLDSQLENIDLFIAMSEFSKAKHREFGFTRPMEVLPYFLPDPSEADVFTESPRPHERPYFLFVGRLEKIKGLDDVIPVFDRYPDADLLIAGDGNHEPELVRLAAGSSRVRFLGRVSLEKLRQYYSHAIATLVPSMCFETFGIVIIESFRQRTPVIARNIGPFPEIVSLCNGGELFQTETDLISAMRRLQSDSAYRETLAANAYAGYVSHWSESAVMPRYLELIERARRN